MTMVALAQGCSSSHGLCPPPLSLQCPSASRKRAPAVPQLTLVPDDKVSVPVHLAESFVGKAN